MMGHAAVLSWEGGVGLDSDVARLRRGDPQALEALLSRYQHRLYRYLLRLVRDPALAEDLFQQTWLRVARRGWPRMVPRRSTACSTRSAPGWLPVRWRICRSSTARYSRCALKKR